MHAGERKSRRERHRMLLADPHVEKALRKLLGEVQQPCRRGHCRSDGNNLRPIGGRRHEGFAENVGVGELRRPRASGQRVEGADAVQLVDLVIDRRAVAVALLGDHVHDHRRTQSLGPGEHLFERGLVMAVDDAGVLDAKTLENRRWLKQLLETFLDAVCGLIGGRSDQWHVAQEA